MPTYATIQGKIDYGLGKAGAALGQPFSAYRIGASSSGDFPSAWTSVGPVSVFRQRVTDTKIQNALKASQTVWYELIGGMQAFLLGDVFVSADPAYVSGQSYGAGATFIGGSLEFDGFAFAWHPPVAIPIGARLDNRVRINRPVTAPRTMADGTKAWGQAEDYATPLVLTNGTFGWGTPGGQGSFVPAGFSSSVRTSGSRPVMKPDYPGSTSAPFYHAYLPYLPGYEASEGDELITESGARYRVTNPYKQEAGVVGSQLGLERLISQDA